MPTLKSEFVELAAELIGDEFADFANDAAFTQSTGFDYETQANTTRTQTIQMIRLEYNSNQLSDNLIKVGDVMLIGEYVELEWQPSPDNTEIAHESVNYSLLRIDVDPASATITAHCRPL